jgi:hypothetical protein
VFAAESSFGKSRGNIVIAVRLARIKSRGNISGDIN